MTRVVDCRGCRRARPVNSFGRCCVCGDVAAERRATWYWGLHLRWLLLTAVPAMCLIVGFAGLDTAKGWLFADRLTWILGEDTAGLVLGFMSAAGLLLWLGWYSTSENRR